MTGEKCMTEERRQNVAETNRGSYYSQEEWLEEFLDDKGDENYNKNNEQQQLSEDFAKVATK